MFQTVKGDEDKRIILPFLKWAGGKRWLVTRYPELFPKKFNNYIEPFVGSGAVFFHLQPSKAILADINGDLIDAYRGIKEDWEGVWKQLEKYQSEHNQKFYYKIRSKNYDELIKHSARFIYLNRTCWNGLYRVNKQGVFNVPIGTKTSVVLDTDEFSETSKLLKGVRLLVGDYKETIGIAEKDDFLFIDPPYTANHNTNGFLKYNDKLFSWDDQVKLRNSIKDVQKRGVKILLTNANHESVRDLYSSMGDNFIVERPSVISGKASGRGKITELVVRMWEE